MSNETDIQELRGAEWMRDNPRCQRCGHRHPAVHGIYLCPIDRAHLESQAAHVLLHETPALVAAAPDLLAACKLALDVLHTLAVPFGHDDYWMDGDDDSDHPEPGDGYAAYVALEAAIAKATIIDLTGTA